MAMSSLIVQMAVPSSPRRSENLCRAEADDSNRSTILKVPPLSYTVSSPVRNTRTPHSGYHFDGTNRRFFEGWYFKISIPETKQNFAWMYSIEDPGSVSHKDLLVSAPKHPGTGAQIMGPDDEYLFQFDQNMENFWGERHELCLGNTFQSVPGKPAPKSEQPPHEFWASVKEGYQVTPTWHQGFLVDNGSSSYVKPVATAKWEYSTRPIYGWGSTGEVQKATAGWLAALPVFEPHWQICMSAGLSTGWVEWGGRRIEFEDAISYSEKNWGGAFPHKWFWIQCNVFDGVHDQVALTAGGGKRGLPLVPGASQEVAMVGVHYDGKFYEFVPWAGTVDWEISTWGSWRMSGQSERFKVTVEGTADAPGTLLRAPTADSGLVPLCKDTFDGKLRLRLWERRSSGEDKIILDTTSEMAALEVGGGPWYDTWSNTAKLGGLAGVTLGLPINVEGVLGWIPNWKPPGL